MRRMCFVAMMAAAAVLPAPAQEGRIPAKGFAVDSTAGKFHDFEFTRRPVGDYDVLIEIMYSGICHSDIHHVHGDWKEETFPLVPGHEIAGRVAAVGPKAMKFKVGDYAGVGCLVNACGACDYCRRDLEQYCSRRVLTYGMPDGYHRNEITYGGYSDKIVVAEKFAVKIPAAADMARVAPLLCAGITTYSPIRFSRVKPGDRAGVAGYGGLGHMAVQYLAKLGADVVVFDITEDKREDAMKMGAKHYVNVTRADELQGLDNSFDFIISTVPSRYDPMLYVKMLKMGGELAIVGLPANRDCPNLNISGLVFQANRKVYGSQIGGIKETQEMLDYSVRNGIYPRVELIPAEAGAITGAYRNVLDGKVKFRYVIDLQAAR